MLGQCVIADVDALGIWVDTVVTVEGLKDEGDDSFGNTRRLPCFILLRETTIIFESAFVRRNLALGWIEEEVV